MSELLKLSKCAQSLMVAVRALESIKARGSHVNSITASQTARDALDQISHIHGWETAEEAEEKTNAENQG